MPVSFADLFLSFFGGVTMFFMGYYIAGFLNPLTRAKLMTTVLRKPYGIMWVISKNDELEPMVINFNKNFHEDKKNNRIFVIQPAAIYRQGSIRHQFVPDDDAKTPMRFDRMDPKGRVDPNLLNVVIEKLKMIAEQKALLESKELRMLVIGAGIISLIGAGLIFEVYSSINSNIIPDLNGLTTLIKTGFGQISAQINNLPLR